LIRAPDALCHIFGRPAGKFHSHLEGFFLDDAKLPIKELFKVIVFGELKAPVGYLDLLDPVNG